MTMFGPDAAESEDLEELAREETRHDAIELRAYELSLSSEAGGDLDNWLRAERELQALDEAE
jgi:hypothetical protein